jgi:hypothetical protein
MKTCFTVIILLLVVSLIACKKFGRGYIEGVVSETGTDAPIEGATIILKYWQSNCAECPYLYDSVHTDGDGRFILYFKKQLNHQYEFSVKHKDHFPRGGGQIGLKKTYSDILLDPYAFVKIRVKKTGNSSRTMSGSLSGVSGGFGISHKGGPIDTVLPAVAKIRSNIELKISWTLFATYPNTPASENFSVDTTVAKNDTLIYAIQYD